MRTHAQQRAHTQQLVRTCLELTSEVSLPLPTRQRFLAFMNDLLSSGNIPGLFPAEDMDDIIDDIRPTVKRAGLPDTRDNCWDMFINTVRDHLHVILCFSSKGDPIKVRTRRFPALVNCVVIVWFQPWPEEALTSVSKHFLSDVDLGDDASKENIINFIPYSFLQVKTTAWSSSNPRSDPIH